MSRFEIRDKFYLDGKPFKVISGSIHYFRTVPDAIQLKRIFRGIFTKLKKEISIGTECMISAVL